MCFKTKFEHFMHHTFLITCNELFPSSPFTIVTKIQNSKKYIMSKFNANIKLKLSLRWVKYVNIKHCEKN
jgi:hypothetical protein